MFYLYLHGFASGPSSLKAQYFKNKFTKCGYSLCVPDLNLNEFTSITVSKMLCHLRQIIGQQKCSIIASSLGGLIGLILAEENPNIQRLILLAPALEIKSSWLALIGESRFTDWQKTGLITLMHSEYGREFALAYSFVTDFEQYQDRDFRRQLPCLIFHGINDETIPIAVSYNYQRSNHNSVIYPLPSDHGLTGSLGIIWQKVNDFLFSEKSIQC